MTSLQCWLTITLIPKERSIANKLKLICVDNNRKHIQRALNLSVIVKKVEVTLLHFYSSISLLILGKKRKNMSGFKIISVHEYQNRTRLVSNKYINWQKCWSFFKSGFQLSIVIRVWIELNNQGERLPYTCIF